MSSCPGPTPPRNPSKPWPENSAYDGTQGALAQFDAFDSDNDPFGGHDFGTIQAQGHTFFKIDACDTNLRHHSPDPADPAVTCRVMTLMLSGEYR